MTAARRCTAYARFDLVTLLRNPEQLLLTVVIPLVILWGATALPLGALGPGPRIDTVAPGVLALAVLSTAFTALAISTGFERRSGALRLLATTPLTRGELLAGKALSTLSLVALQCVLISGAAGMLDWRPTGWPLLVVGLLLGTLSLAALGMAIAGVLRAEATLAVANGIFLVLLLAGGTVLPTTSLPTGVAAVVGWLPTAALGDWLRIAAAGGTFPIADAVTLLAWTVIGVVIVTRRFRWT